MQVPLENEYLFGNFLLEAIPHPNNWIGTILNIITLICHYMGGITFFVFSLPIVYLFYSRRFGNLLAYALFSTGIINGLLKYFFASPRPSGLSEQFIEISSLVQEHSFGLPSGHSHISILVWGLVFFEFKNLFVRILAPFFILFTPLSRIYAGVHYPGDVLFGFLCGLISLLILENYKNFFQDFPNPQNWKNANSKIRSISLGIIFLTLLPILLESHSQTEQHFHSLSQVISASASLCGFFISSMLIKKTFPHQPEKIGWENPWLTGFLLLAIILILYFGFGNVSKKFFQDLALARYIRYFLLIFSIVYLIPYILQKKKKHND